MISSLLLSIAPVIAPMDTMTQPTLPTLGSTTYGVTMSTPINGAHNTRLIPKHDPSLGRLVRVEVEVKCEFSNWALETDSTSTGGTQSATLKASGTYTEAFVAAGGTTQDSSGLNYLDNDFSVSYNYPDGVCDMGGSGYRVAWAPSEAFTDGSTMHVSNLDQWVMRNQNDTSIELEGWMTGASLVQNGINTCSKTSDGGSGIRVNVTYYWQ
ncbi:MAG: hypothetical protein D6710_01785 [Nitrospirae bacterium]|nr:MAG: hypothetical protein D6710_01785 [Nitrospirota bacterium]